MDEMLKSIEEAEQYRKSHADKLTSTRYDLDILLTKFMGISMTFYSKGSSPEEQEKFPTKNFPLGELKNGTSIPIKLNVYEDLITLINSMFPTLVAPFHHYNNYIDYYVNDFLWDDIKYTLSDQDLRDSNVLRRTKYQVEIQALLLSLKAGLDRLVGIFSYYYKGISPHTTFGRYKESKEKFEGFMHTVSVNLENDKLMAFIHDAYFSWIKYAVAPRDIITHYNDLGIYYEFNTEIQGEVPIHYNARLIKEKGSEEPPIYNYSHDSLKDFTENWLSLLEHVFSELVSKEPITYYPKF